VDGAGNVKVNDVEVAQGELAAILKAALEEAQDKVVVLKGDKTVLLGQAVNVLDLAQQAGATGIAIATQQPAR
jgi:biopolymer transport protein ExbD